MAPRRQKGKPTIEQRLEAITQTLEITAGMQMATEKELAKLEKVVNQIARLTKTMFVIHEARIQHLEGKG